MLVLFLHCIITFLGPSQGSQQDPVFATASAAHTTLDLSLKFHWVDNTFPSTKPSPRFQILPRVWIAYLKWFLASVNQLVSFQLWTLHKCFPTFSTHMNPGSMSVEVFPHCWVITKHLSASLVWTCYCPVHSITHLFLHFHLVARPKIVRNTCYHLYSNTSHFKTRNYTEYMQVQT